MSVAPAPPAPVAAAPHEPTSSDSRRRIPTWAVVGSIVVVAGGLVLRFWTRSDLWLDESLSVNIARLPAGQIHGALRQDGAPPLYYFLLHVWMVIFGTSNEGVRSLSGAISVVTLPTAWVAGRRLGGTRVAAASVLLVASSPFAVRYATEARMYSLVMLEAFLGYLAVTSAIESPSWRNLGGIVVVTAALLYTHYWSLYLLAATALTLAYLARRPDKRRACGYVVASMAAGCILFLPWVPTFLFQLHHTGTPWSEPVSFAAMVNAVSEFSGGVTNEGRALGLTFFALAGIGLFGAAIDARRIELDLRSRPAARPITIITIGTLGIAIVAGLLSSSGFQARYASVVFPTFMLLVATGLCAFSSDRIRRTVLAGAIVLGFIGSAYNVTTDRTQATQTAAYINAHAQPGDIVAYCPDQLGPDTSRLIHGDVSQITFPRGSGPRRIDWVDYAATIASASPQQFARSVLAQASGHTIYFVWASGYQGYKTDCEAITAAFGAARPGNAAVVAQNDTKYFEFSNLYVYRPTT